MTEHSYFYNGVGGGDAIESPYHAALYDQIRGLIYASSGAFIYAPDSVISATDPCGVTHNAGQDIDIDSGVLLVYGLRVELTSDAKTVPSNSSGMPRMDRVVARIVWGDDNTLTASFILKTGIPNTVPIAPDLLQIPYDVYEIPLARIYVPSGIALADEHIVDEREFIDRTNVYNFSSTAILRYAFNNINIMPNSEFMAQAGTSGTNGALARGFAPAFWELTTTNTSIEAGEKFDRMERGSTCVVTCPTNGDGMITYQRNMTGTSNNLPVTIRLLIEVVKGEVLIDFNVAGLPNQVIPVSVGPVEVIWRTSLLWKSAGTTPTTIQISITNNTTTETIFKLGQVTIAHGWVGAPYIASHEMLIFNMYGYNITAPAYDIIYHTGNINLYAENTPISDGANAWWVRLEAADDNSNGTANLYARILDFYNGAVQLAVEIGNMPNTRFNCNQGLVGIVYDTTTKKWLTVGLGVGTNLANFHCAWYILGCCT